MAINTKVKIGYNYDTGSFSVMNPITGEMIYLNISGGLDESMETEYSKDDVVSFFERVQDSVDMAFKTVGLIRKIEYYNSLTEEDGRIFGHEILLEEVKKSIINIAENIKKGID